MQDTSSAVEPQQEANVSVKIESVTNGAHPAGAHPAGNVDVGGHLDIGLNPEQQQVLVWLPVCLLVMLVSLSVCLLVSLVVSVQLILVIM